MTVEFIDTNVLVYAADPDMDKKYKTAVELVARLAREELGALSTQVLTEFYNTATRKLHMTSDQVSETIMDLKNWRIHRPSHADIVSAIRLQSRHQLSWWDSLIITSALESGAGILWSEDLNAGQKFGPLTVRNPFVDCH